MMTKPLLAILLLLPLSTEAAEITHQYRIGLANTILVIAAVLLALKLWDRRSLNKNRPRTADAIAGRFGIISSFTFVIVGVCKQMGIYLSSVEQLVVAALCIASFASTLNSRPDKVWTWHFIALGFNTAVIVSIYYWVWNDNFALRYFWYAALIGAFFFTTIESIFISRSSAEDLDAQ